MRAAIEYLLCIFLLSTIGLSENNSKGFTENSMRGQQESSEQLNRLILEQILGECRRLGQEVTSLRKQITKLEHQNLLLRQDFSNLKQTDKRAKYYQNETLKQNQISKRLMLNTESGLPMTPQIAFSAVLTTNLNIHYPHERFVFDYTVTNSGNGYNKNNGLFVTPVKGVYVFFVTVVAIQENAVESQIVRNGNNIGNIFSAGSYGTGSNMAVTNLDLGDAVWVRNPDGVKGTVDGVFTQFSGFLLFETF